MAQIDSRQLEASGQYLQYFCHQLYSIWSTSLCRRLAHYWALASSLGKSRQARRAYLLALQLDAQRPLTFNNLAILELGCLNSVESERWVMRGLACHPLSLDDEELLQATACDLRLFQLRPDLALDHVEQQLAQRESAMALANRAVCLHRLARLSEAIVAQEQAIRIHLAQHTPLQPDVAIVDLVGQSCADLQSSIHLQTRIEEPWLLQAHLDVKDSVGLRLLLSGLYIDQEYWHDSARRQSEWDGNFCNQPSFGMIRDLEILSKILLDC